MKFSRIPPHCNQPHCKHRTLIRRTKKTLKVTKKTLKITFTVLACPFLCIFVTGIICYKAGVCAFDDDEQSDLFSDKRYSSEMKKQEEEWKAKCERRAEQFERRKSLSVGEETKGKCMPQDMSILFTKLPLEMRQKIYGFVLNDETFLHLTVAGTQFVIPGCAGEKCPTNPCQVHLDDDEEKAVLRHTSCMDKYERSWRYKDPSKFSATLEASHTSRLHFMPLLLSCRRVYTEAIDLLYTQKTFIFSVKFQFRTWARSIPPARFALIRSLVLHWTEPPVVDWDEQLELLGGMPRLKRCRVLVHFSPTPKVRELVERLVALPNGRVFVVDVLGYSKWEGRGKWFVAARWEGGEWRGLKEEMGSLGVEVYRHMIL
ncbi:hypothetical protein K458DRAFT_437879 [Lentithecium fluviatile CBS 122367]|uniref:DUF7730 domain-containing protein n=1 Tax=Lentithecium fluviatile CBS 122367 TaxID=1168545 RepID=A0A6G1IC15_9PLEO|nr:hypothetical protein K458DRAFT_437879 [Lentithecium fluviatile CBS 122367]